MIRREQILNWFMNEIGFSIRPIPERDSISLTLFSGNSERHGAKNLHINHEGKPICILKCWRELECNKINEARIKYLQRVLYAPEFKKCRNHVLSEKLISIDNAIYGCQFFVDAPNAYVAMRSFSGFKYKKYCFEKALDFCVLLEQSHVLPEFADKNPLEDLYGQFIRSYDSESEAQRFLQQTEIKIQNSSLGIVHGDLVPSNILINRHNQFWVVDWEYATYSFSVFNFFDVLLHFGSLFETSIFKKRNVSSFLNIFGKLLKSYNSPFIVILRKYFQKSSVMRMSPKEAALLFYLYLLHKSTLQYRTYGYHSNFDLFWYRMLKFHMAKNQDTFHKFWYKISN